MCSIWWWCFILVWALWRISTFSPMELPMEWPIGYLQIPPMVFFKSFNPLPHLKCTALEVDLISLSLLEALGPGASVCSLFLCLCFLFLWHFCASRLYLAQWRNEELVPLYVDEKCSRHRCPHAPSDARGFYVNHTRLMRIEYFWTHQYPDICVCLSRYPCSEHYSMSDFAIFSVLFLIEQQFYNPITKWDYVKNAHTYCTDCCWAFLSQPQHWFAAAHVRQEVGTHVSPLKF